jgi:hypothetical protein
MKKYKIVVSGRGSECYVYKLNEDQHKQLLEFNVESGECDSDKISNIIGVEGIFTSDDIFLGPYNSPEDYIIQVYKEDDNKIWESKDNHEFNDYDTEYLFELDKVLLVDDFVKGEFYSFEIEIDGDFDPDKLIPIVTEISERIEIITGFIYNDVNLSQFKEYGDYWSKGITYYLN